MKKLLLLFCVSGLFLSLNAQTWCTTGSTWHYAIPQPGDGYAKYTYLYDTLVGTQMCNKIKTEFLGHGLGGFVINYSGYIYTYSQSGIVYKNNGSLNTPQYDTLYNFSGAIGTKWRTNLSGGQACAQSYIEITGSGSMVIQGQTLNYRTINYTNYYWYGQMSPPQNGTDTLFERIGTRHNMEFITGGNCADATDVAPFPFRCFSDYQINNQMSTVACDYITAIQSQETNTLKFEVNNPVTDIIHITIKGSTERNKRIILMDQFGNKVYDHLHSESKFDINMQDLAVGLYVLQISYDNNILNQKLVIQK